MEKTLIELGLDTYKVAGIIGLLVFFICILVFVVFTIYARRVKGQTSEIREARDEVKKIQGRMQSMLEEMLKECEESCMAKDRIIDEQRRQIEVYRRNEIFLNNEIEELRDRVRTLEAR